MGLNDPDKIHPKKDDRKVEDQIIVLTKCQEGQYFFQNVTAATEIGGKDELPV